MASSNMQYYVRTPEGKEYGPAEQDVLAQWAKAGRITSRCQIRNALVQKWSPATKMPFLEGLVREEPVAEGGRKSHPEMEKIGQAGGALGSLNRRGKFRYVPASLGMRFGAWLTDTVLLVALLGGLVYWAHGLVLDGYAARSAYGGVTLLWFAIYLLYYTLSMGITAQTVGQWFWGIMVVRPSGLPVLTGRACLFAVLELLFCWTSLLFIFVLPSKRGLQDLLSGVAVIRITVREIAAATV